MIFACTFILSLVFFQVTQGSCISKNDRSDDCLQRGAYAPRTVYPTYESHSYKPRNDGYTPPKQPVYYPPPVAARSPGLRENAAYRVGMQMEAGTRSLMNHYYAEHDPKNYK
jgi:hypothetical protein